MTSSIKLWSTEDNLKLKSITEYYTSRKQVIPWEFVSKILGTKRTPNACKFRFRNSILKIKQESRVNKRPPERNQEEDNSTQPRPKRRKSQPKPLDITFLSNSHSEHGLPSFADPSPTSTTANLFLYVEEDYTAKMVSAPPKGTPSAPVLPSEDAMRDPIHEIALDPSKNILESTRMSIEEKWVLFLRDTYEGIPSEPSIYPEYLTPEDDSPIIPTAPQPEKELPDSDSDPSIFSSLLLEENTSGPEMPRSLSLYSTSKEINDLFRCLKKN